MPAGCRLVGMGYTTPLSEITAGVRDVLLQLVGDGVDPRLVRAVVVRLLNDRVTRQTIGLEGRVPCSRRRPHRRAPASAIAALATSGRLVASSIYGTGSDDNAAQVPERGQHLDGDAVTACT